MGYITFRQIEAITKSNRDYVNCSVGADTRRTVLQRFLDLRAGALLRLQRRRFPQRRLPPALGGRRRRRPLLPAAHGEVFNYGPFNHLQRPDQKITAGGFANYKVSDHFNPYVEVMAMTNWTDAQIAPTGSFNEYNYINCDNPLLSDQQRELICGEGTGYGPTDLADVIIYRRNVEGGARSNGLGHDNMRFVGGVRGDINDTWAYDAYLCTRRTTVSTSTTTISTSGAWAMPSTSSQARTVSPCAARTLRMAAFPGISSRKVA